jgi:nitrate reductase gamma subunit
MNASRFLILLAVVILSGTGPAEAAWRLDPERFHVGAHGRLSCQECHETAAARTPHPDPAAVNRRPADFFTPQVCAACHEHVLKEVAEGGHGGVAVSASERPLDACITCHDPHYAPASSAPVAKLDLTLAPEVKCRLCHEFRAALPPVEPQDEACLACHRRPAAADPAEARTTAAFCLACHATEAGATSADSHFAFPRLDPQAYAATPHQAVSCLACHPDSERYGHGDQRIGECRSCHHPHPAATTHEVHLGVACGSCHVPGAVPVRQRNGGGVGWNRAKTAGLSAVHRMPLPDREQSCRQCHFRRNGIGAPAAVLPPKSVLCMPCHAATFSAGDATTVLALIVFAFGAIAAGSVWVSGGGASREAHGHRAKTGIRPLLAGFFMDGLLQRRLFRYSKSRWAVHALVFFPFVARFLWGLAALAGSRIWPEKAWVWVLLDQNHPLTAFVFDLTGLCVLAGAAVMVYRRFAAAGARKPEGLPPADWPAYGLLGGIVVVGFILEGLRIALSGYPQGSAYAFVGDALSRIFHGAADLEDLYGYVWYGHAILTGLFLAYLPFSRMFHIILAPVFLALRPFLAR